MPDNNTNANPFGVVESNGFTLPIISETTIGKKGASGKQYFTVDLAELTVVNTLSDGTKQTDETASLVNLGKFFRGVESLLAFVQPDLNKALVSAQVTTPANGKTPKVLSQDEKLAVLRAYLGTIHEETKRRSGVKSQLNALTKRMAEAFANGDMVEGMKLAQELAALHTASQSVD